MSNEPIGIDFLSDLDSETLQASGPFGRVYDLQLQRDRIERTLEWTKERLYDQIDEEERQAQAQGHIGSLTSPFERVERDPDVRALTTKLEEARKVASQAQREIGGIVFLPATDNLPRIQKQLATLNKKAGQLNSEPIGLTVTDEKLMLHYTYAEDGERGYNADFEHVFTMLTGTTPKIEGFEFLAAVEPTEHGNVVKRIPAIRYGIQHNLDWEERDSEGNRRRSAAEDALDTIDLSRFHHSGDRCEHEREPGHVCGRRCKTLYVVYNEQSGEAKQVGRNCLRDFTGVNNPEKVLKALEQVWEFMRSISRRGTTPLLPTKTFLTHCATIMRHEGGYKKGLGHDAASNYWNMVNNVTDKRTRAPMWIEPTPFDEQQADMILDWLKEWDESSSFADSVKIALAGSHIDPRHHGLGGAAYTARDRWLGRADERKSQKEREEAQEQARATQRHIGTEGQREVFILTVKDIKWIADNYSYGNDATKPLIIMSDQEGNAVKWFASNLPEIEHPEWSEEEARERGAWGFNRKGIAYTGPAIGATYQVKATVSRHEDDPRWGKSTIISRAKFEQTISEPEAE